ncbi:tetratricopeptide repeat domain 28 [Brachyspira pilosicoli WesB]|uniref:Tetratricopeptide repeat domain 28 n=1 Tax=Brachyspira pilosicoli WesB TaxID=1161918 RepID=K0JH17_BRAPL|nr:tetratricopeptide repeat protein [Brachyspira pilosicoli]CCG56174.1 tetratricopeptide repeat domain 28 [Brachyspira pilosicoli WesB]
MQEYNKLLEEAENLYKNKKYRDAIEIYEKSLNCLSQNNNGIDIYKGDRGYCLGKIGNCYAALNDFMNSIKYLKESINMYPNLNFIYDLIHIYRKKLNDINNNIENTKKYSDIILFYSKKILEVIHNKQCEDDNNYKNEAIKLIRELSNQYNNEEAKKCLQSIEME